MQANHCIPSVSLTLNKRTRDHPTSCGRGPRSLYAKAD